MNELALFAGAGGGILGGKLLGWRTICYVENDSYCIKVIKARVRDGYLDDAPIWDDVKTFDGKPWAGCVDIITAGFPCQPFSVAGKRQGQMDERNLWPDTIRIIREVRPEFCLLENVPGLIRCGYFETILKDLAESGYDARWKVISASEVGAPHKRDRLWIVAYSTEQSFFLGQLTRKESLESSRDGKIQQMANAEGKAKRRLSSGEKTQKSHPRGSSKDICNPTSQRLQNRRDKQMETGQKRIEVLQSERSNWWATEPELG